MRGSHVGVCSHLEIILRVWSLSSGEKRTLMGEVSSLESVMVKPAASVPAWIKVFKEADGLEQHTLVLLDYDRALL